MKQCTRHLCAPSRCELFHYELSPAQPRFVFRGSALRQESIARPMLPGEPKLNRAGVIIKGGDSGSRRVSSRECRRNEKEQ